MKLQPLDDEQRRAWAQAQELWGVRLHDAQAAPRAGMPSFAWFGFPPSVTIDPVLARRLGADRELGSVFAHEIGHHVLAPSTRRNSLAMTQQIARALTASSVHRPPDLASLSRYAANLWSDLLINTRVVELQRGREPSAEPGMIRLWRILATADPDPLFWVVLRASEELWGLPDGTLCPADAPDPRRQRRRKKADPNVDPTIADARPALDATLLAATARAFADDPVRGALRFGMIAAPYLLVSPAEFGSRSGCAGDTTSRPPSAAELGEVLRDPRLQEEPVHPGITSRDHPPNRNIKGGQGYGLAQTLALYDDVPADDVLTAWYLERARPWIRPYSQPAARPAGPDLPGAAELWEIGDDPAEIDWPQTLAASATVIPGVTTRRRGVLDDGPAAPREAPVELDLYVDSSGSMPAPQWDSPALVAGTILIGSVIAGGGRVRVTSFSGPGDVAGTPGPTANRSTAMAALLTSFGNSTTFPLDLLERRYATQTRDVRRHLVVLSDDGLESFFGAGQPEYAHVAAHVRRVLDTATLVVQDPLRRIADLAAAADFDIEYLDSLQDAPGVCAALAARIGARRG